MNYHSCLTDALRDDPRVETRPDWIVGLVEQNLRLLDRIMSGDDVAKNCADIQALGRVGAHRT